MQWLFVEANVASACYTDAHCSRNGVCLKGECHCDSGWKGTTCGALDLGQVPEVAAYGMRPNVTSWGGNPVLGDDGRWHLFVAEITAGCGLAAWETNSQCTHAASDSVLGPFAKVGVALPVWAHSCRVVRDQTDGTYLLFHVGDAGATKAHPKHCPPSPPVLVSETVEQQEPRQQKRASAWLHKAQSPQGPWTPVAALNWTDLADQCGDPSPLQHDDGSWSLACNSWPRDVFFATAPHYSGPWSARRDLGGCATPPDCPPAWPTVMKDGRGPVIWEDQFHWVDARGAWHLLAHAYVAPNFTDPVAGHAHSGDGGVTWQFADVRPYDGAACGPRRDALCGSRERPWLLFDEHRRPTHLVTGVNAQSQGHNKDIPGDDWTYTLTQPINLRES